MTSLDVVLASELEPGRYVVVRTASVFGWVIRIVTGSRFDHAFVLLEDGEIAEATTSGVRIDRLSKYTDAPAAVNSAEEMTPGQRRIVISTARSCAGRAYNWADLLVILARKLGFRQKWLLRAAENRGALICSELVALAGQSAGMRWWLCAEPDASQVTPALLGARPCMRTVVWDG